MVEFHVIQSPDKLKWKQECEMGAHSRFVYIIDRYLEVSNVYHQRMTEGATIAKERSHLADRVNRLLVLLEGADPQIPKTSVKVVSAARQGQTVVITPEFLIDTKHYQEDILRRLEDWSAASPTPHNLAKLRTVLRKDARDFLAAFPTPTYAWDILTELASISVCPNAVTLATRDMIHMHSVELQLHLARVIAQVWLSTSANEITLTGTLTVEQLKRLGEENRLIERLIEFAVPRDPAKLLEKLLPLVMKPEPAREWLLQRQPSVLSRLQQETRAFPDTLEDTDALGAAPELCDQLVVFGLVAAYAAWFSCACDKREERGSFRTSILFCTRILLDEKRWMVCRDFAMVALSIVRALNLQCDDGDPFQGTGMITANSFFARRMCGESLENIRSELRNWETEQLHKRYHFLKYILLEEFESSARLASELLRRSDETGKPELCVHELREWPILAAFRESDQGKNFVRT